MNRNHRFDCHVLSAGDGELDIIDLLRLRWVLVSLVLLRGENRGLLWRRATAPPKANKQHTRHGSHMMSKAGRSSETLDCGAR